MEKMEKWKLLHSYRVYIGVIVEIMAIYTTLLWGIYWVYSSEYGDVLFNAF